MVGTVKNVLVCGFGHGGHCMVATGSSRTNIEVRVLSLFQDQTQKWSKVCEENNGIEAIFTSENSKLEDIKAKPALITNDPELAAKGANIIILIVPAFAHASYLTEILPFIEPNTLIVGLPGQAGFEFQVIDILGKKAKQCAIMSFESLPWTCRTLEIGKTVQVFGFKETLAGAVITGSESQLPFDPFDAIQEVLGEYPKVKKIQNYISVNLMALSIIHPPLMCGKWGKWNGKPLDKPPLFYQGVDEKQANMLSAISDELIAVGKAIEKQRSDIDMSAHMHIFDWFKVYHRDTIVDSTNLVTALRSNSAYIGLLHPMKTNEDGKFVPDFRHRYMCEDIPYGLVVMKGIAEIAGVATPTIDEVIQWCQEQLGKEFIVGNELKGKDLGSSRAPQFYGFRTLDDLFNL